MPGYRTIDEFCDRARLAAERSGISTALMMITELVQFVISHDSSRARVFTSKELDLLCLELGGKLTECAPRQSEPRSVFIATALYNHGGHSRVMRDVMNADPLPEKYFLLTNVDHNQTLDDLPSFLNAAKAAICPNMEFEQRVRWLQQELMRLSPQRIYIFSHHFDSIAIAAVQPGLAERVFYIHHCDHSLALGNHIPHATHVDLHAKGFFHCRETEGIAKNVIWPLVAQSPNVSDAREFLSGDGLKTCTSGGFEKFESPHLREQIPYSISYSDVVPRILASTGGAHMHIGQLSENMLNDIRSKMEKSGIAQEKFQQIPYVPEFSQALVDLNVDLYVASFPLGGGKAAIEAMSAGLPILAHSNYRTLFFSGQSDLYPEAMVWRKVDELVDILSRLTKQDLIRHSALSRRFFEARHQPYHLKHAIAATLAGTEIAPPDRPSYHPDALQSFFDEQIANDSVFLQVAEFGDPPSGLRVTRIDACQGYIDRIDDQAVAPIVKVGEFFSVSGWTSISAKEGRVPDNIYVTLSSMDGRVAHVKARRERRADVANAFGHPKLRDAGFSAKIDASRLSDPLMLGIARETSDRLELCDNLRAVLYRGVEPSEELIRQFDRNRKVAEGDRRHAPDEKTGNEETAQAEENYAPALRKLQWRIELEIAKLLCKIGLTRYGTFLWSRAMTRRR
jgi:hypothetical protein